MNYTIHKLQQGTPDWAAHRAVHLNASDAAAMLGLSSYKTRGELLKEMATGLSPEIDAATQARFDAGHAFEKAAKPLVEAQIGDELFPVTVSCVVNDLHLSSSLDGIVMDGSLHWEHKTANQQLAESLARGEIPAEYAPQMEQGLLITGADRCLFSISKGTPGTLLSVEYRSKPELREKILLGWKQFKADLASYNAPASDPIIEKRALLALPALSVQLVGKVTTSNLPAYRNSALQFIEAINTDLQTDQDFADAEQTVKFCEGAEKNLKDVKDQAIAQTASIDELFRSIDQIAEAMRQKRLLLERLVKSRKEQIRAEIVQGGRDSWNMHVRHLNERLARVSVTILMPDFGNAIKGKRTLASLRDAVDSALLTAKLAANQQAQLYASHLAIIDEVAKEHGFLVRDLSALVSMPTESLSAVIKQRISDHDAEQARKAAERDREQRERDAQAERDRERDAQQAAEAERARQERESDVVDFRIVEQDPQPPLAPASVKIIENMTLAGDALERTSTIIGRVPAARTATVVGAPPAQEIIQVLSQFYEEPPETIVSWLRAMNLSEVA